MQLQVNLLPKHYRPKPNFRLWPVLITTLLICNLLVLGGYWLFLTLNLDTLEADLLNLESRVSSLERQVADAQWRAELEAEVNLKAGYINSTLQASRLWYPLLFAIERSMEPGLVLTSISGNPEGDVIVGGIPRTVTDVANMLGSIQVNTGLPVVLFNNASPPGETFQLTLKGWSGREVPEDE